MKRLLEILWRYEPPWGITINRIDLQWAKFPDIADRQLHKVAIDGEAFAAPFHFALFVTDHILNDKDILNAKRFIRSELDANFTRAIRSRMNPDGSFKN